AHNCIVNLVIDKFGNGLRLSYQYESSEHSSVLRTDPIWVAQAVDRRGDDPGRLFDLLHPNISLKFRKGCLDVVFIDDGIYLDARNEGSWQIQVNGIYLGVLQASLHQG